MKKNILLTATLAFLGLATAPLFAQTSTSTTTTSSGYIPSSSVIGSKIKDSRGQDVGEIKDVVLDRSSGCLAYVVLSTRGTGTTATTKTVAAPWSVLSASSEPRVYMTRIEREKIYSAPAWESTRIEEYSRPEYITQVYGYYGVTPSFSVGVTSTSGTTTTGVTASTNASATPAATASVGATMTPAATASAAATMTPSTSATVKPSPVPAISPSPATKAPATTKSPAKTKSPAAESATSPAPKKKSEKKSSAESAKTDADASDATKSTTKKTETKTEKAPKSDTSTETSPDSSKSKSKKEKPEKKPAEPETAPTP